MKISENVIGIILVLGFLPVLIATESDPQKSCDSEQYQEAPPWIRNGGFIALAIIIAVCFWGLSAVCDYFFLPSLNCLCELLKIPDDMAGATIMPVGTQSPQLFITLACVFLTRSSFGVGTAIGSGFFSPLCACAGAVFCSKDGTLTLDWRIIVRECFFYIGSLLLLIWTLKGTLEAGFYQVIGRKNELGECLIVEFYQCVILVSLYLVYIYVCVKYDDITAVCCPIDPHRDKRYRDMEFDDQVDEFHLPMGEVTHTDTRSQTSAASFSTSYASYTPPASLYPDPRSRIPAKGPHQQSRSPSNAANDGDYQGYKFVTSPPAGQSMFDSLKNSLGAGGIGGGEGDQYVSLPGEEDDAYDELAYDFEESAKQLTTNNVFSPLNPFNDDDSPNPNLNNHNSPVPSINQSVLLSLAVRADEDLYIRDTVVEDLQYQCYLYKRSTFYSKIRYSAYKWQLKWFILNEHGLFYCRYRNCQAGSTALEDVVKGNDHVKHISILNVTSITIVDDEDLHVFQMIVKNKKYEFRAADEDALLAIVRKLKNCVKQNASLNPSAKEQLKKAGKEVVNRINKQLYLERQKVIGKEGGMEEVHPLLQCPTKSLREHTSHTPQDKMNVCYSCIVSVYTYFILRTLHVLLYPIKYALYSTIIDTKKYQRVGLKRVSRSTFVIGMVLSIVSCMVWLALFSYVTSMCSVLLSHYLGISSSVMGLTVSALGTSFPSIWSALSDSKNGFGKFMVQSAFGSNVFSVFIGLGLPWLMLIGANGGDPYANLKDEGIVISVAILIVLILCFLFLMVCTGFKLHLWMGPCFILTYVMYVSYAVIFTVTDSSFK